MSSTVEALQAEVFRLSPVDPARLLDHLIAGLDVEAEAAWDSLASTREQELRSGAVEAASVDAAIARLEARFPA
jgi:hypothetical protein